MTKTARQSTATAEVPKLERISKVAILFLTSILFQTVQNTSAEAREFRAQRNVGNDYCVSGKIIGAPDGWIYLAHSESLKTNMRIDSAKITGGEFSFSGIIEGIAPFILGLPNRDKKGEIVRGSILYQGSLILSPGNLYIEGEYGRRFRAQGTEAQNQFNLYTRNNNVVNNKFYAIKKSLSELKETDSKKKVLLENELAIIEKQKLDFIKEHVSKYSDSEVSAYILLRLTTADSKILKTCYNLLSNKIQNSKNGKKLLQLISDGMATDIGSLAPEFALNDTTGNLITLDSFKGHYVFIDFWASWCGPCREENPNLMKIHDAYHEKGLKIVGISLDSKREAWVKAIKEDKLPWLQLGDQRAAESDVAKKYNIKAIPMNFLVDKEGRIIGRNLKGNELKEKLMKLL